MKKAFVFLTLLTLQTAISAAEWEIEIHPVDVVKHWRESDKMVHVKGVITESMSF